LLGKEQQMAWFKVDDGFYSSMKFLTIRREYQAQAAGIWLLAGTWSADKMTDGFVPFAVLDQWVFDKEVVEQLIGVGLWKHDEERFGIQFHDWCDYQPTREALEAKAVARSEKNKQNVAKRWGKSDVDTTLIQTVYETDTNVIPKNTPEPEPEPEPFTSNEVNTIDDFDSEFDEFWSAYPRRENKQSARRAMKSALKKTPFYEILAGATRYRLDPNRDPAYTKHAATWLNNECWNDDPLPARGSVNVKQQQQAVAAERFLANFEQPKEITSEPDWA
jgi:hypothetical protein